jgi:sugar/nucleoside kinase (ribokinase family)
MRDILVIGSLAYDTVKTPSGVAERALGGSANYFSVAASFFSKVNVVGVVGEDYSKSDRDVLLNRGVNLDGMQTARGLTFHWEGFYEGDLSEAKTLKTDLNVFAHFNPEIPAQFKKNPFVFLANIDPELQLQVLSQMERPMLVGMDSMNYWISSKKHDLLKIISKVDIVFMNDAELKQLTGESNVITAIKKIPALGPKYVVIKRGEFGSMMYAANGDFFITPALPIENVIDPTGAGDSFAGGFFGWLVKNSESHASGKISWSELKQAVRAGTIMSSQTIQDFSVKNLLKLDAAKFRGLEKEHITISS